MAPKMLSINLWYSIYSVKTNAQVKSFRKLGYETHIMTVEKKEELLFLSIYNITDNDQNLIYSQIYKSGICNFGYRKLFSHISLYISKQNYHFIYIRRLMSKLLFAAPYFKKLSLNTSIIYELPSYPIDKAGNILYGLRDFLEWKTFCSLEKHITLVLVVVLADVPIKKSWLQFTNAIDISNYIIAPVPELSDTIKLLAISNMAVWHRYDRLLYAIKQYSGPYKLHLTMISRDTPTYTELKELSHALQLDEIIDFLPSTPLNEIVELSKDIHLGVGNLTFDESGLEFLSSLKTKDYCAMGLPFFSSRKDMSFPNNFGYHYVIDENIFDIDLSKIIAWYENIHKNPLYRKEMYDFADKNLQFDQIAKKIVDTVSTPKKGFPL